MNQIIVLGSRLVSILKLVENFRSWLESYIKRYAENVRNRYPHRLYLHEKIVAPIVEKKFFGTIANLITVIRILLAVIIFQLLLAASPFTNVGSTLILASIIFVPAAILDFLDGSTARALGQISELGKILDPLADKILLASVLIPLGYIFLPSFTFWFVISQEGFLIFIAVIKKLTEHLPFTMATQANQAGKIKNFLELVAGTILIFAPFAEVMSTVSNIIFLASIPFGLGSIFGYLSSVRRVEK